MVSASWRKNPTPGTNLIAQASNYRAYLSGSIPALQGYRVPGGRGLELILQFVLSPTLPPQCRRYQDLGVSTDSVFEKPTEVAFKSQISTADACFKARSTI